MKQLGLVFAVVSLSSVATAGCSIDSRTGGGDGSVSGADGGLGGGDANTGPRLDLARVSGRVWAPGNAPGMVPAGHEIPIFDALVRLTATRVTPIPETVYCEQCVSVSGSHARSAHDGTFEIGSIVPGTYWLTVEKGQFRLETQITLAEGEVLTLDDAVTTLPSTYDPANGRTIPRIAVGAGAYDHLEDVLGKMAIGGVDSDNEWTAGPGSDRIHFFTNGGRSYSDMGTLESLVRDLGRMMQYHVIFIPCASDANTHALDDQAVLRNIRDYVAAGGKLYVSDWSGEWMDNVFPAHVDLGPSEDTPASAYDPGTNTWNTSLFGDADGSLYNSENAEAIDPDLHAWLNGQMGPTPESGPIGTFDASLFDVVDNWNYITSLNNIQVGLDAEGLPVLDMPIAYVIGGAGTGTPKRPLTVTFEPAGCGRVLFSTYHTTPDTHVGLVPQERILLYLIMQIGVCKEGPILI